MSRRSMIDRGGRGSCVVDFCNNAYYKTKNSVGNDISYFKFPKNDTLRRTWLRKCHLNTSLNNWENKFICSEHFTQEDFERDYWEELMGVRKKRKLKPDAVPTLKLGPSTSDKPPETLKNVSSRKIIPSAQTKRKCVALNKEVEAKRPRSVPSILRRSAKGGETSSSKETSVNLSPIVLIEPLAQSDGMKCSDVAVSHKEKPQKVKVPVNKLPDGKPSVRSSSVQRKTSTVRRKLVEETDQTKDPQTQTPPKSVSQPVDKIVTSTPKPVSNFQKMFLIVDKPPVETTSSKVATSPAPDKIAFVPYAFQPFNNSAAAEDEKSSTMLPDGTDAACPVHGIKKPMYYLITSQTSLLTKEGSGAENVPVESSGNTAATEHTLFELNCTQKEWTEKTGGKDIIDSTSKSTLSRDSVKSKSSNKSADDSSKAIRSGDLSSDNSEEKCAVLNCPTNSLSDVKLFEFPPAEQVVRYVRWLQFTKNTKIKRKIKDNAKYYVCARHFDDSQFTSDDKSEILSNALPTKNPPNLSEIFSNSSTKTVSVTPTKGNSSLSLKITSVESLAKSNCGGENEKLSVKDASIIKLMSQADDSNSDANNDEMVLDCGNNLDKSLNAVHEVWDPKDAWNRYKEQIETFKRFGKYKEPVFNSLVKLDKNRVRKKRKYAIVLKNIDGVMEIDKLKELVLQKIDYVYGLINEASKSDGNSAKVNDDSRKSVDENSELARITKEISDVSDNRVVKTSRTDDALNSSDNLDHDYACLSSKKHVEDIYRDLSDDASDKNHSLSNVNDFSHTVSNEVTVISNDVSKVTTVIGDDTMENHVDDESFEADNDLDAAGDVVESNDITDEQGVKIRNSNSSNTGPVMKKNTDSGMSVFDLNTGNEISVKDLMETVSKVASTGADSGSNGANTEELVKVIVNDGKFAGKTGRVQLILKPINKKLKTKRVLKLRPVNVESSPVKKEPEESPQKVDDHGEYRMNDRVPGVLSKYRRIPHATLPNDYKPPLISLYTGTSLSPIESNFHASTLCDLCGEVMKDGMVLKTHTREFHIEKKCNKCGEVFPSRRDYHRHHRKVHREKKAKIVKRQFVIRNGKRYSACPICEQGFYEYGGLKKHKLVVHNIGKYHVCDVCGKKCVDKHLLLLHKATHSKQRPIAGVCPDCGRSFMSRSAMNSHIRIHHRKTVHHPCPVCGKVFVTPYKLRTHIARHTNGMNKEFDEAAKKILSNELKQKEYRCVICNCILETGDLLKQHMEYHKDDESIPGLTTGDEKGTLPCCVCNERFAKEKRLAAHLFYIHNEMPPFICRDKSCDSKYWTAKELDLHCLSIHVKRLFTCKICSENFSLYHEKLKHMKTVHQVTKTAVNTSVECPICFKEIRSKNAMGLHMVVHNDKKDLVCGICGKEFHSPGGLASHLRVKHGVVRNKKTKGKAGNSGVSSVVLTLSDVDNIINQDNKPPLETIDDIISNAVECDIVIDDDYNDKDIGFELYQNEDVKFKCPDCNELFGSEDLLNEHILITHNEILFEQEV